MIANNSKTLITVGALMLISGWLIAFLMVLKLIEENFYLILLAYAINLIGLLIGLYGISSYMYVKKRREQEKEYVRHKAFKFVAIRIR